MLQSLILRILLLLFVCNLCSFSLVPPQKQNAQPPVEQKKQKRHQRLQKRHTRLLQRFDKAKNSQQQSRLQKKIQQVERQQGNTASNKWGHLGFWLSILSVVLLIITFLGYSAAILPTLLATFLVALLGFLAAIAGLIVSIVSLNKIKMNPEEHKGKGFGITGIIISSIMIIILGTLVLLFFLYL